MERVSNWTECSEPGCSQVTRERKCSSCFSKVAELSWAQTMPCPQCDQVFLSPRALKDHLHLLHWGRLVHLCDHCGETFFHSEQLKRHENSSHPSIVEEIIEIPMELKSFEKVETDKEEEEEKEVLAKNSGTSNNSAIGELLSEIGQGNLANFTRAYIGSVRKHLEFKHQENFTDCHDCFTEDPLSVLFAGKASNLQPSHGQDDTFDQLWRLNALSKGNKDKLVKLENGNLSNELDSDVKEADMEKGEGGKEYFDKDEEEGMDLGESDAEDEDLADYEETDDELEEMKTALGKDLAETKVEGVIDEEVKESDEDKIDPSKKSLGNMNTSYVAPLRRRLYGF